MREPAARPVMALLTDFGTRDPYVGAMKGAALSVCADATLVDLTHDIAAHDVAEAARHLAAAAPYFPAGTAFVAVVDPGVGSARRALAAWACGHWFVGPDNGVLTPVLTPDAVDRRDHVAALHARPRQPDLRRPRSVRAGGCLAAARRAARRARPAGDGSRAASTCRGRASSTASCAACWSRRIASATSRRRSTGPPSRRSPAARRCG